MADGGIYRKTEKGRTEVATRANKLGLRERTMLIMVDDKTTRAGLLAKNAHPTSEGILNSLLSEGYIETVPGTGAVSPAPAPIAAAAPVAVAAAPTVAQAPVEVSLTSASRFACRALVTYLGPGADDLTTLIEKCKTVEELSARLEKCREVLQAMAGKKKADEFWAGASARLPAIGSDAGTAPADPAQDQPPAVEVSLASASRFACHALMEYLGPGADDLTALIEKASGAVELAIALEKSRHVIQDLAGRKKADAFWAGVSARLPQA